MRRCAISCSVRVSAAPTRWRRWSSPAGCGGCRTAMGRRCWSRSSARTPRSAARPSAGSVSGCGPSSTSGAAATCPAPASTPVPGRVVLHAAPQGQGRAGAGRLGHRHRRTRGVPRPWAGGGRVDRRLARVPPGPGRPGAWRPAAGHLRRRQGRARRRGCCPLACTNGVWCMCAATSSPRSPPTPKTRSRGLLGGLRPDRG